MAPLTGLYRAIVVNAHDPQNRGRARLRIPQIMGTAVTGWAEPISLGAVLEGDRVVAGFDGGDHNCPLFWPMVRDGAQGWIPLTLDSGWSAGTNGPPSVRLGADGMLELDGSVKAASARTGTPIKFARLPTGILPIHTSVHPVATEYRTAYSSRLAFGEWRATTTTTSASYVTDSNGPAVTFVAPSSGAVVIVFGALMRNDTSTGRARMGIQIKDGSTVITGPDDNRSAECQSQYNSSVSNALTYTALIPGHSYTAMAMYRSDTASNTASFDNKWISVTPTVAVSTPMALVSMETSGDLKITFPPSHYTPYAATLNGVRARVA
ncbi:hypothetical protein ACF06W_11565 [Streptomyces albus]|uniref:hypothetical protein n=1 Tax=Streptomyces albus TaxID=1888 RepID=UPI0036F64CF2